MTETTSIALYRKYRPKTFKEVLGQRHVTDVLRRQIQSESYSHAYLFSGTRGTGKTTMARLLAAGVNCTSDGERPCGVCANCVAIQEGKFVDVVEIDAASNRKIDDARDLKSKMIYPPISGRKKIYIIDEVHMLTKEASNALLKTLEEPPEYIMFVLATTEPEKLINTIRSRCLKFAFERVSESEIEKGLERVASASGMEASKEALSILAQAADGSVRDGLSLLEQALISKEGEGKELTAESVQRILGRAETGKLIALASHILRTEIKEALVMTNDMLKNGIEERALMTDIVQFLQYALLLKYAEGGGGLVPLSEENIKRLNEGTGEASAAKLTKLIEGFSTALLNMKWAENKKVLLELAIISGGGIHG